MSEEKLINSLIIAVVVLSGLIYFGVESMIARLVFSFLAGIVLGLIYVAIIYFTEDKKY